MKGLKLLCLPVALCVLLTACSNAATNQEEPNVAKDPSPVVTTEQNVDVPVINSNTPEPVTPNEPSAEIEPTESKPEPITPEESSEEDVEPSTDPEIIPIEDAPNLGDVEVDNKLLTVDITLPASFFEDLSDFDADAYAEENGFKKAVINEDGSVVVTMTKTKHAQLMDDTTKEIEASFSEMYGSEDTPYIKKIEHADDFSEINIVVDRSGYEAGGIMAAFVPLQVYLQSSVYQIFSGSEIRSEISFVDEANGSVIESVVYPDDLG